MEDGVNPPPRGDLEVEGHVGDDFLHLKGTSSFHLEFLWSVHVEVGGFEPDFVSYFPRGEFRGYPVFHFLLGHFVGSLGILLSGGQV